MRRAASIPTVVLLVLFAGVALAEKIPNWAAPSTWTPPGAAAGTKTSLKTGLVTIYNAMPFIPVTPCRVTDTRAGSGFPAGYGPPSIGGGVSRNFTITGKCGIPSGAQAVSFNFAVWNTTSYGDFKIYPQGGTVSPVSTLNWGPSILMLANAAVLPLGSGGITVVNEGSGTVDLFFDVNGYYSTDVSNASGTDLYLTSTGNYTIYAINSSSAGTAIKGTATGTGYSWGVYGHSSGAGYGVFGENSSAGPGVFGLGTGTGVGVQGISNSGGIAGVSGVNNTSADNTQGVGGYAGGAAKVFGVQGQIGASATAGSAGVHGIGAATTGKSYGVLGENYSTASRTAAVFGKDTTMPVVANPPVSYPMGVYGEGGNGVVGYSSAYSGDGVLGAVSDGSGNLLGAGILGYAPGSTNYGVYAWAGTIGCNGCTKQFVEAHPYDASKTIHYVAIEGPEAGTYFRGTAATVNGSAVIVVPDHFRWVTSEEGMTVQLTTVGGPAQVWVEQQSLDQILVRSNRDVRFHYLVQGVREAFRDFQVIQAGREFLPQTPNGRMQPGWSEFTKSNLVSNGTYNPDGTINMRTAERLGWAQKWREDELLRQQAVSRAPQEPEQTPRQ